MRTCQYTTPTGSARLGVPGGEHTALEKSAVRKEKKKTMRPEDGGGGDARIHQTVTRTKFEHASSAQQ